MKKSGLKKYTDFLVKETETLLNIDSPTGYTENAAAWVQRISGAGMVLFIIPHLNEAYGHVTMTGWFLPHEPTVGRYLLEAGLLVAMALHLWQSLPRLPLSFGLLRDERSLMRWRRGLHTGVLLVGLIVLAALSKYFLLG